MKKIITPFLLVALCALSCQRQEDTPPAGTDTALRISAVNLQPGVSEPVTRADAALTTEDATIGMFRAKGSGANPNNYVDVQTNIPYTFKSGSGWRPMAGDKSILLQAGVADVYGYYPYVAANTDPDNIPLAARAPYTGTALVHDPGDLCYATSVQLSGTAASTALVMKHALSLVTIQLSKNANYTGTCRLTAVSISGDGMPVKGTLRLSDGTQTPGTQKEALTWATDQNVVVTTPGVYTTTAALLVPHTPSGEGTRFNFTVDGKVMQATVTAAAFTPQAGHHYTLTFELQPGRVAVDQVVQTRWIDQWNPDSQPTIGANPVPLNVVSAGIMNTTRPVTRADEDLIATGVLGLFRSQSAGYTDAQNNVPYAGTSGTWAPQDPTKPVYLLGSDARVYSYYPYDNNTPYNDATKLPLASAGYSAKADFCYAAPLTLNGASPAARLVMRHALGLLELKITRTAEYRGACSVTELQVSNDALITASTLDITQDPGVYATGTAAKSVTWATALDVTDAAPTGDASCLLIPFTPEAKGLAIRLKVNSNHFTVTLAAATLPKVEAGKRYTVNIQLNGTAATVADVKVTPWVESPVAGGDVLIPTPQ